MWKKHRLAMAAIFALGVGTQALPAQARFVCIVTDQPRSCEGNCRWLLDKPDASEVSFWLALATNGAYGSVNKFPYPISSCKVTPSAKAPGWCRMTICGHMEDLYTPRRPLQRVTQPTPKPKVGPPGPGLLEGDGGFTRQGPAATGTPLGTGTSSPRAPSADSLRVR
jgi:hypothetical protein